MTNEGNSVIYLTVDLKILTSQDDWWDSKIGLLFVISVGNISCTNGNYISRISPKMFEEFLVADSTCLDVSLYKSDYN